jgi:hypothetical protein
MDQAKLISALMQIEGLAAECLEEINPRAGRHRQAARRPAAKPASAKTLPAHILRLREGGLFKQAKTAKEVRQRLQAVYPCDLDRVAMVLLRLQRRKQLRKTSKKVGKKQQVAYVW